MNKNVDARARRACGVLAIAALLAIACLLVACGQSDEGVAAKVGGEQISEADVSAYTADFRVSAGLEDDEDWLGYLETRGLDAKSWREQVIASFADSILVKKRAAELGITADKSRVDAQVEADIEAYGGESEYAAALEAEGTSADERRESYELADIEQQLLATEVDLDDEANEAMVQEYIDSNFADRVLRRYSIIVFDKGDKERAQACLDELAGLEGAALDTRFSELAEQYSVDEASAARGGDAGWNLGYSLRDGNDYLMLDEGELYGKLIGLEGEDGSVQQYEIVRCTKRFAFEGEVTLADIDDDDLRLYLLSQANVARSSALLAEYLDSLRDAAKVQVREMPAGLPYDVDAS